MVNCVGMLVQASQDRVDQAILINSYLPHFLSGLGKKYGFKLIHISTDCVFSGDRGGYAEDDFRDGDTPYARTKALGEVINDSRSDPSNVHHWPGVETGRHRASSLVPDAEGRDQGIYESVLVWRHHP